MALDPNLEEQALLAETLERADSGMTPREHVAEALVGVGFILLIATLSWLRPPENVHVAPALVCVLVMALAMNVRFDTPLGFTVPTQLAFVPLLFALPLGLVPVGAILGLALAQIPALVRGTVPARDLRHVIGNASLFTVGPVVVFLAAGTDPQHAGPGLLLAALAAQFVGDFAISALRFSIDRGATLASQLRDAWVYGVDAALSPVGFLAAKHIQSSPAAGLAVVPLLGLLALFAHERHHRLRSVLELNDTYRGTALVLGDVVEADDGYTGDHSKGVVGLAVEVGDALTLDAERRRNLEFAALLHDVGKIAIPKEIINKPGKLDAREWAIIKTHTLEGQRMLDRVGGFMHEVGLIVRAHHERWDGGGYPDRLAGEAIPLEARIIACCDSWNAMRTDRPYRKALPHDVALVELVTNAGSQFDPDIVKALVQIVAPMPAAGPELPVAENQPANALEASSVRPIAPVSASA
jgi:HD-GYP domain-containing protein (c-di-GMP phosphodiesterase class II)